MGGDGRHYVHFQSKGCIPHALVEGSEGQLALDGDGEVQRVQRPEDRLAAVREVSRDFHVSRLERGPVENPVFQVKGESVADYRPMLGSKRSQLQQPSQADMELGDHEVADPNLLRRRQDLVSVSAPGLGDICG